MFISPLVAYHVRNNFLQMHMVPTSTEYDAITRSSEIYACNSVQKRNTRQTSTNILNITRLSCLLNFLDHFKIPFCICFFPS